MKISTKNHFAIFLLLVSLIFNGCTYEMGVMGAKKDKKNQQTIEIQIDSLSIHDQEVKQSLKKLINKNVIVTTIEKKVFYGTLIIENLPASISIIPENEEITSYEDEMIFPCTDIRSIVSLQGPKIKHTYTIFGTFLGLITDGIIVILILGFPYIGYTAAGG